MTDLDSCTCRDEPRWVDGYPVDTWAGHTAECPVGIACQAKWLESDAEFRDRFDNI